MRKYTLILLTILVALFLTAQACQNFYLYQGPDSDLALMCTTNGEFVCDSETLQAYECETGTAFGSWRVVSTGQPCSSIAVDGEPVVTTDVDNDGVSDALDVCPGFDDMADTDADGIPNGCETVGAPVDTFCTGKVDGDYCKTVDSSSHMVTCLSEQVDDEVACNECDENVINNVPLGDASCEAPFALGDTDNDGVSDAVDVCPGFDDTVDVNNNGIPDFAACVDWDNDGLVGSEDTSVCTDTGNSLYTQEFVTGVFTDASSGLQEYAEHVMDQCSTNAVLELYCADSIFVDVRSDPCDPGQICASGACVSSYPGKDLVVNSVQPAVTNNGLTLGYAVQVKNVGSTVINQLFSVHVQLIGSTTQDCVKTVSSLTANTETTVSCSFNFTSAVSAYNTPAANPPAPASYTFKITLDSTSQVVETDETNNIVQTPFMADLTFFENYSSTAPIQLSVTGVYDHPFPDQPGLFNGPYYIKYTLHNNGFLKSSVFTSSQFAVKKSAEYLAYASAVPPLQPGLSLDLPILPSNSFSPNSFLNTKWQQAIETKAPVPVAFKYTFDNWATFTPFTITLPYPTSCVDYDGGNNNAVPSYVRQSSVENTDSCVSTSTFQQREWYCQNGVKTNIVNNCPSTQNQYCFTTPTGGACQQVVSCSDSDNTGYPPVDTNSYTVVGTVTLADASGNTRVVTDSCDSLGRLAERTCNNAAYVTVYSNCTTLGNGYSCSSGKCVSNQAQSAQVVAYSCTDADNSAQTLTAAFDQGPTDPGYFSDHFTRTTITRTSSSSQLTSVSQSDVCTSTDLLKEYYCTSEEAIDYHWVSCSTRYGDAVDCVQGRCLNPNTIE